MLDFFSCLAQSWGRTFVEQVGKILPVVFRKRGRLGEPTLVDVLAPLWARAVGKPIAQESRPVAFEAGTLTLVSGCPSWTGQLRLMAEEIRAGINSFLGTPVVKRLRVQLHPDLPMQTHASPSSKQAIADDVEFRPGDFNFRSKLDPETARIVQRSFAKYFARKNAQQVD